MEITLEDLCYDGPADLFCAGTTFGGDKVAALGFATYNSLVKMHPEKWWHHMDMGKKEMDNLITEIMIRILLA